MKQFLCCLAIIITNVCTAQTRDIIYETFDTWLTIGVEESMVLEKLGVPSNSTEPEVWEITGCRYHYAQYDNLHLTLLFEDCDGRTSVSSIVAEQGCSFATSSGVKIGEDQKKVNAIYSGMLNFHIETESLSILNNQHEGTFFVFEAGKLIKIIVGSLAE